MLIHIQPKPWTDNKKLTVINFLGGPGTGKSFLATEVLQLLRRRHISAQPVGETAKEYVWDNRDIAIEDQLYILGNQYHCLRRLVYHNVDVAVLDSSILLGLLYKQTDLPRSFDQLLIDAYNSFDNINILVTRSSQLPFEQTGRNENFKQSCAIDDQCEQLLHTLQLPYFRFTSFQAEQCVEAIIPMITTNKHATTHVY